jgi:hypothetical protein
VAWCLFTLCGLLAALVLLSDPRLSRRIDTVAETMQWRIGRTRTAPDTAPAANLPAIPVSTRALAAQAAAVLPPAPEIAAPEPAELPAVRLMPQNRIPVRRAGQSTDD